MGDHPSTASMDDAELRSAAILGQALLLIDSAREYGFVEGGPAVNVERVEDVTAAATERGLTWGDGEVQAAALEFVAAVNGDDTGAVKT